MILKKTAEKIGFGTQAPDRLKFWAIQGAADYSAKEVHSFKDTKPLVFYCGGIPVMSHLQEPELAICREIRSYLRADLEKYGLFVVAESSISHMQKYDLPGIYNDAPESYCSAGAEEFVRRALLPLVADATTLEEVKRQFSRVNLIGHSYGVTFIQNVSNALRQALKEQSTLTDPEIQDAMSVITSLNLGPSCKIIAKKADFTQLFITAADDEVSAEHVNYTKLVTDAHPVLGHARISPDTLVLLSKNMGDKTLAVKTTADGFIDAGKQQEGAHSLRLYMNVNGEPVPGLRVYQVNASAQIARDFLNTSLEGSLQACTTLTPRHPAGILNAMVDRELTPYAKDEIGMLLRRNQQMVAETLTPKDTRGTRSP